MRRGRRVGDGWVPYVRMHRFDGIRGGFLRSERASIVDGRIGGGGGVAGCWRGGGCRRLICSSAAG